MGNLERSTSRGEIEQRFTVATADGPSDRNPVRRRYDLLNGHVRVGGGQDPPTKAGGEAVGFGSFEAWVTFNHVICKESVYSCEVATGNDVSEESPDERCVLACGYGHCLVAVPRPGEHGSRWDKRAAGD